MLAVLGHGLGAVLDGGDVDDGVADRPGDVPGGGGGDPLAGLLWHRVADGVASRLDWLVGGHDGGGDHSNGGDHSTIVGISVSFSLGLGLSFGLSLSPPADRGLGDASLDKVGAGVDHGRGVGGGLGGLGAGGGHHLPALLRHHHVLVDVHHSLANLPGGRNLPGFAGLHRGEGADRLRQIWSRRTTCRQL